MTQDQRRDRRIVTRQKLWREGQGEPTDETRDVSQNGMFIVSEDAPEVGSQLQVTINDAEGEATLNLEVMWRGAKDKDNKTGVGVRIVGFEKGRDVYEKFINRHIRSDSKAPQGTLRPSAAAPARPSEGPMPRPSQGPKTGTEP